MPRNARLLSLSIAALTMAAAGCASVPEGSVDAAAVTCPEGSDCYDVPRAIGDGGAFTIDGGEFYFENIQGTYWAGDIEVTLDNVGVAEHSIVFVGANEGSDNPVAQALGGEQDSGVVNLFEGEYVFYCSIPGHRAQGMEGELTVYPTQEEAEENLTEAATEAGTGAPGDAETSTDAPTEDGTETESPATSDTAGATETPTDAETATEG